jgi:hypothetical protein
VLRDSCQAWASVRELLRNPRIALTPIQRSDLLAAGSTRGW